MDYQPANEEGHDFAPYFSKTAKSPNFAGDEDMLRYVHATFNHASIDRLRATIGRVKGVDHLISTSAVIPFCDACVLGKHTRRRISNKHARVARVDSLESMKPYLHFQERILIERSRENDSCDHSVSRTSQYRRGEQDTSREVVKSRRRATQFPRNSKIPRYRLFFCEQQL